MLTFVIICIVVSIVLVISLNYQNIKKLIFKDKKPKEKAEKPKKKEKSKPIESGLSYNEDIGNNMFKDSLYSSNDESKYQVETLVQANEQELKELQNKKQETGGGRLKGVIKSIDNINVEVEDLDFDDEDDDLFGDLSKPKISKQIKNLPPELKAILLSDILKKKDE